VLQLFWVFPRAPWSSEDIQKRAKELFDYYYPIEIDPDIDDTERALYMKEWNEKVMTVLWDHIDEEQYQRVMGYAIDNILIRDGIKDFFSSMQDNWVPIIVFSAWVSNVIQSVLEANSIPYDSIHWNELWFNKGRLELINQWVYIWEKNWHSLPLNIRKIWSTRSHKILLWDSMDDLHMWDESRILSSIWFLTSEKISKGHWLNYRIWFDHVIESDTCDRWFLAEIQKYLESTK